MLVELQTGSTAAADRTELLGRLATAPVRACFESLLARAPLAHGEVVVAFTIGTDGKVSESRPDFATLADPEAEQCVADAVRQVSFTPRDASLSVLYPFVLITERTPLEVARALKLRYGLLPKEEANPSGDPRVLPPPGIVVIW